METIWAQIEDGIASNIIVSIDPIINNDWLVDNFGGTWVEIPADSPRGVGMTYNADLGVLIQEVWDEV